MNSLVKMMMAFALALMAFAPTFAADRSGWVKIDTQFPYAEMVTKLDEAVKAEKMGVVTRASATKGAEAAGIQIPGNMVVGVYRNDFARRMLAASIDAGIEAPIRFYITQREDGNATLSYKTPGFVFAPYLADAKPDLAAVAGELDAIFDAIAKRATQ